MNNALTANIIEIKEVEIVDDFDDTLQEELFGRPVTDLDSLWCSDWASEDVGDQHWPHTNTDQVPILTKKQENLTLVNTLTMEAKFHQEWMAPNEAFLQMHVSKHWLQTKGA